MSDVKGEVARGCLFVRLYGGELVPSREEGDTGDYDGPVFFFTREKVQELAESARAAGSVGLASGLLALLPLVETTAEGPASERGWYVDPADSNFGRDNVWGLLKWFTYDELAASMLLENLARQIGSRRGRAGVTLTGAGSASSPRYTGEAISNEL
jgi:hypothetical protein